MSELTHISVVLNKVIEELIGLRDEISSSDADTPAVEVKEPVKTISLNPLLTKSFISFIVLSKSLLRHLPLTNGIIQ